jgi:hypothetical protein
MREYLDHIQLSLQEANEIKRILDKIATNAPAIQCITQDDFYDILRIREILIEKGATP